MSPPPNLYGYLHACSFLRKVYGIFGIEPGRLTPGMMVASEYGDDLVSEPLGALFAIVDEVTALYRYLSFGWISTLGDPNSDSDVFYRICVKTMSNLASIRALCALGFDGNARIQLRLHYETMILWSRLRIDPDARRAFRGTLSPDTANAFWHRYLKGGKSEKALVAFSRAGGGDWIGSNEPVSTRVAELIGVSSHPSHLEMTFNAQEDWTNGDREHLVVRGPTPSSHFTLGNAIRFSAYPLHIPPEPLHRIQPPADWRPPEAEALKSPTWGSEYYEALQEIILAIFVGSQPFLEGLTGSEGQDSSLQTD